MLKFINVTHFVALKMLFILYLSLTHFYQDYHKQRLFSHFLN